MAEIMLGKIDIGQDLIFTLVLEGEPYLGPVLRDLSVLQPDIQLLDLSNAKVSQAFGGPINNGLNCLFPARFGSSHQFYYFVYISFGHISITPTILDYSSLFLLIYFPKEVSKNLK